MGESEIRELSPSAVGAYSIAVGCNRCCRILAAAPRVYGKYDHDDGRTGCKATAHPFHLDPRLATVPPCFETAGGHLWESPKRGPAPRDAGAAPSLETPQLMAAGNPFDDFAARKSLALYLYRQNELESALEQIQAEAIGHPHAVRAVAKANGDNRVAIIVPCHRVIGADGELVGYGGGLWRKCYLLNLESGQKTLLGA